MRIQTVTLTTADGVALVADLAEPVGPTHAVIVAHPHPLFGGDRHHPVVDAVWRTLTQRGAVTLRLDFRGAGESSGHHDGHGQERLDVLAAMMELEGRHPNLALWLVGYSFGAVVAADIDHARLAGWVLIAPPLGQSLGHAGDLPACARDSRPCVVLVPQHDEYCSPACIERHCRHWNSTRHEVIANATHGLVGRSTVVATMVAHACADDGAGVG